MTGKTKRGRFDYAAQPIELEQSKEPEKQGKPVKTAKKISNHISVKPRDVSYLDDSEIHPPELLLSLGDPMTMTVPPQRRGRPDTEGEGRMAAEREQLNVRVKPQLKRAAAGIAGLQGKTLGDVVEAALIEYLERHT